MAAGAGQQKVVRREQRIIERPRLIKLLDDSDARTILLLAPAGYGKTTLARQWAKTLNGVVWVTLTAAHRDVAVIASEVAGATEPLGEDTRSFVATYVRAHSNPQRIAREVAVVVSEQLTQRRAQWVILDDYQEVAAQPEVEEFVEVLIANVACRFLIPSRLRPGWATARRAVYGDVFEITRTELALSADETRKILARHPEREYVAAQADGWPAVVGLAATGRPVPIPGKHLGSGLLHNYFAEEIFKSAPEGLQRQLMRLALASDFHPQTLGALFGEHAAALIEGAKDLGFVNGADDTLELHPLMRDFLLAKLTAIPDAEVLVRESIAACVSRGCWERAFDLILRFDRTELVESVLETAYTPLIRSGQVATLEAFAERVRSAPAIPPPVVDLAEADIALADGAFDLASRIAERTTGRLRATHPLTTRANTIIAESAYARARLAEAEQAYRAAFESAKSEADKIEALRGWALSSLQGETPAPTWLMELLDKSRTESPLALVRHSILELTGRHFGDGYGDAQPILDEGASVLRQVADPRARSSFAHVAAYVTALGASYDEASRWQQLCDADIDAFDLDFARPHSHWNNAFVALGLRRFGACERLLQQLEDTVAAHPLDYHVVNARILRARLALQTGRVDEAIRVVPAVKHEVVIPSIHGEYLATRGLALAIQDRRDGAMNSLIAAEETTRAVEVRVLTACARVITAASRRRGAAIATAWETAQDLGAWDPLVAVARSSTLFAQALADTETIRSPLADLYRRTNDLGLMRRGGLRTRAVGRPATLLSPREFEVLGLLARGFRNRDIADALVVSPSTVKVHVRHILEKLGVRTRSEAVARLATIDLDT